MMRVIVAAIIFVATASGHVISGPSILKKPNQLALSSGTILGVVNPISRCGGVGTPIQLRISDCDGVCKFTPGQRYDCEKDFMPSSAAPSLTLQVVVCTPGLCFTILEVELANSSVQPGFIYTARYSIVPNDFFSGRTISFQAYIFHSDNSLLEICVEAEVEIL